MTRKRKEESPNIGALTARQVKRRKPINSDLLKKIEPITETQQKVFDAYALGKNIVAYGSAGTGKSFNILYNALKDVLNERTPYEKIYITRSLLQIRDIGYLPGPQPLDAKLLTPDGWVFMGDIKVGDYVIGRNGHPTKVLGVYPKGKKLVYRVTTTEGTSTECCEDHLWLTKTYEDKKRGREGSVKTTREILNTFYSNKGKINHYIPRNDAVHFPKRELPIPPYILGALLGDGSFGDHIALCNMDMEVIERVDEELDILGCSLTYPTNKNNIIYGIRTNDIKNNKTARRISVRNVNTNEEIIYHSIGEAVKLLGLTRGEVTWRCNNNKTIDDFSYSFLPPLVRWQNPIKDCIHKLGLQKVKAYDKFIPDLYKYSSIEDRIDLLRGLMDTDGTIKKNGNASFTTTSKQLADDLVELVRSLGGRATYSHRDRTQRGPSVFFDKNVNKTRVIKSARISYDLNVSLPKDINPFYLSRKAERFNPKCIHHKGIKSIEPVCEKEVQCILVEDPEHLYITDEYIVTHNTEDDKKSLFEIPYKNMVKHMFNLPVEEDFEMLYGNLKNQGTLTFMSTSFLRGVTFDNAIIIVDEFQNANFRENDTIITRVGENCKIMFCGDVVQSDITRKNERSGIHEFLKILGIMPSFELIEFGIEDVCRSGLVKEYLLAKHQLNTNVNDFL